MPDAPLLDIADLHINFATPASPVAAVRGLSLTLGQERLAIVGESGSGKSATMRAALGLLPATASVKAQRLAFRGQNLLGLAPKRWRTLRGRHIAMVVQDPRQGFTPVHSLGAQMIEMLVRHRALTRRAAWREAEAMLAEVQIRDPSQVLRQYPHELSGGMAQRAMIAMMLAGEPALLIADEATSALDVVVQQQILALIDTQVRRRGMGLILISHQLDLVARFADRILVMYAGRVVEELRGGTAALQPVHPYTIGLLHCRPTPASFGRALPVLTRDPAWLA